MIKNCIIFSRYEEEANNKETRFITWRIFSLFSLEKNVYKKSSERENNQYETYILYIFGQLFSDGSEAYAIRMNKLLQI